MLLRQMEQSCVYDPPEALAVPDVIFLSFLCVAMLKRGCEPRYYLDLT